MLLAESRFLEAIRGFVEGEGWKQECTFVGISAQVSLSINQRERVAATPAAWNHASEVKLPTFGTPTTYSVSTKCAVHSRVSFEFDGGLLISFVLQAPSENRIRPFPSHWRPSLRDGVKSLLIWLNSFK